MQRSDSTSFKKAEAAFARKLPPLLERLLTFGPRAALAASVSGFAWVAGSYFSGGQSQFYAMKPQPSTIVVAQESLERAELLRMKQKMAEDIRALQARVEGMPAARSMNAKDATSVEHLKRRLDAMKRETGTAIADLAGKIEHMQRETTAKFSRSQRAAQSDRTPDLSPACCFVTCRRFGISSGDYPEAGPKTARRRLRPISKPWSPRSSSPA